MRSHSEIENDRVEALLRGDAPAGLDEAHLQGIIRELRTAQAAVPERLRARVDAISSAPLPRSRAPRRALLVLVPAIVALLGAAGLYGLGASRSGGNEGSGGAAGALASGTEQETPAGEPSPQPAVRGKARTSLPFTDGSAESLAEPFAPPIDGRARDYSVWMRLRVDDADDVSQGAAEAMSIARRLGGYVASTNVEVEREVGHADLFLRIPVGRLQDAITRLSALGTIVGQEAIIEDREAHVDTLARRIEQLQRAIIRTRAKLGEPGLSATERELLRLQLDRQRGLLKALVRERRGILRQAAFATVTVQLFTAMDDVDTGTGSRFEDAARAGLDFLGAAAAAAVFLLIVASPLLALAAVAFVALRSRRRRIEEQLLARIRPGTAEPPKPATGELP